MKIGIIGLGFVGETLKKVFSERYSLGEYDKYKKEFNNKENLIDSEIIFISVPTPMKSSGEIDLSSVEGSLEVINSLYPKKNSEEKPLVVIRSTIVPGSTKKLAEKYNLNIAFIPEFLREKHALEDFKNSNRFVIGTLDFLKEEKREEVFKKLKNVFYEFVPNAEFFHVDSSTAEMVKYASNSMLACQVIMANEIYNICQKEGIDYNKIKNILFLDERIAKNIDVPGPDGKRGFGGKCFPKDLNALIYHAKKQKYEPELLEKVWELNKHFRKEKDWEEIPGAISENNNFSNNSFKSNNKKE